MAEEEPAGTASAVSTAAGAGRSELQQRSERRRGRLLEGRADRLKKLGVDPLEEKGPGAARDAGSDGAASDADGGAVASVGSRSRAGGSAASGGFGVAGSLGGLLNALNASAGAPPFSGLADSTADSASRESPDLATFLLKNVASSAAQHFAPPPKNNALSPSAVRSTIIYFVAGVTCATVLFFHGLRLVLASPAVESGADAAAAAAAAAAVGIFPGLGNRVSIVFAALQLALRATRPRPSSLAAAALDAQLVLPAATLLMAFLPRTAAATLVFAVLASAAMMRPAAARLMHAPWTERLQKGLAAISSPAVRHGMASLTAYLAEHAVFTFGCAIAVITLIAGNKLLR